jgi:SAM-dependent methyltransferase
MNSNASDLLATAHRLLAQDARADAAVCLRAALRLDPANLAAHNLFEEQRLDGNYTDAFGIDAQISPDDDIFRFFANHPSCTNPIRDYLSDGWRTLVELGSLLETMDRPLSRCRSFLEFASGFGRFSRHLAKALPAHSLHVSDVVAGSVDFLKQRLAVDGFYSVSRPEQLATPQKYEVIFVLSLFSHLPENTWSSWLARLYDALEDGGVLIITTHGEKCARLFKVDFPENGFVFISSSESKALSGDEYGSTFTSSDYVQRAIVQHLPGAVSHAFPARFWGNQDAFAIVKPAAA